MILHKFGAGVSTRLEASDDHGFPAASSSEMKD
jgi:hypothetical protein